MANKDYRIIKKNEMLEKLTKAKVNWQTCFVALVTYLYDSGVMGNEITDDDILDLLEEYKANNG